MITVIAIDNAQAEASLLQLAASFAAARLFTAKQQKDRAIEVQVTSAPSAKPTSRDQLARQKGMFGPRKLPYQFIVSTAYGFDSAAQQMIHELVHIAQIAQKRLAFVPKRIKQDGVKQVQYAAKFSGRKMGLIDSLAWDARPWEGEAVTYGQQIFAEFQAFISGAQGEFPASGKKKDLRLQAAFFALPEIPPAPISAPPIAQPPAQPAQMPQAQMPQAEAPLMADPIAIDPSLAQAQAEFGDMPAMEEGDADLIAALAEIDGAAPNPYDAPVDMAPDTSLEMAPALPADLPASGQAVPAFDPAFDGAFDPAFDGAFDDGAFDDGAQGPAADMIANPEGVADKPQAEAADRAAPPLSPAANQHDKDVFIQGIVAPRRLKAEALSEMRSRLAAKGLLG